MKRLLISLIVLTSCNFIDDPQYVVDPIVEPYVDKFFNEAHKHGMHVVKPYSLSIGLVKGLGDERDAVGLAVRETTDVHLIYLDYDIIKRWKNNGDTLFIEYVVFHELGHSILKRPHTHECSIMNENNYLSHYAREAEQRELLKTELFTVR